MIKRLGTTVRAEPPPQDSDDDLTQWHLCVVSGPDPQSLGKAFPLVARETRLGRDPEPGPHVRVVLADERVSRLHATVINDGRNARIADCESSNGLFVDGQRVADAVLDVGSVVRLGDTLLVAMAAAPGPEEDAAGLGMVGRSPLVARMREVIRRVAASALPVLITGETGTGKEVVAAALHRASGRPGVFVPVNCAALPATLVESMLFGHRKGAFTGAAADQEGAFARADGGSLFLDEIGELTLEAQPKLLRVLEDGEVTPVGANRATRVDARVLTATNVPLENAVAGGRFRRDLYARLAGVQIEPPPLRDRLEDVPALFTHFLPEPLRARPASADFVEALLLHAWPQNVRELGKLAERLGVLHPAAPRWELFMLDEPLRRRVIERAAASLEAAPLAGPPTREELLALLDRFDGNVSLLARHVGRNRKQVYRWMDDLGVSRGTGRTSS
jgi:sigma-54 dependent transcriptional regulator, acetoin dehydrogenase operon transcriptional activator AcoR